MSTSSQEKVQVLLRQSSNKELVKYCCDRKSRATCAQSFAPWQQATIEIMRRNLSYYCLLAHGVVGVLFFTHITQSTQRHWRGCNNIPSFLQRTTLIARSFLKAELGTTSTSWSQHHCVAIGNPKRHVRKASHCGSKQQ